jgi:hypothetical protein
MAELNIAEITTPLHNTSLDGNTLDGNALDSTTLGRTSEDESSLLLRRRLFESRFAARFVTRGIFINATGIKPNDFVVTADAATDLDATVAALALECSAFPLPSTALPSTPLNPDLPNLPTLPNAPNLPNAIA